MATSDIQIAEHALQHHFADMEQQRETSTFGMWMFLLTEIMFFGGLFCSYLVYRASYYQAFVEGSQKMNITLGATNTAVLICSSLTMALAVRCAQLGKTKMMAILLGITMIFGFIALPSPQVEIRHPLSDAHPELRSLPCCERRTIRVRNPMDLQL